MLDLNILDDRSTLYLVYPSEPKFGRFCVPSSMTGSMNSLYASVSTYIEKLDLMQYIIADVSLAWPLILGSSGITLFFSLFYM